MTRLDWFLFGNGHGMRSPFFDDTFFWLVDTSKPDARKKARGAFYQWIGGHGAQLRSRQWSMPVPGETRTLCGREFRVFIACRRGPRVEASWAMTMLPRDIDGRNAAIRELRKDLYEGWHQ